MQRKGSPTLRQGVAPVLGVFLCGFLLIQGSLWAQEKETVVNIDLKLEERDVFFLPEGHTIVSLSRMVFNLNQAINGTDGKDWKLSSDAGCDGGKRHVHGLLVKGGARQPIFINSPVLPGLRKGPYNDPAVSATGEAGVAKSTAGEAITLHLTLRDSSGAAVEGGVAERNLGDNGHLAKFIDELFPEADTSDFTGTLTVTAEGGTIAATAIELGNQPGQFTTLPVNALQ